MASRCTAAAGARCLSLSSSTAPKFCWRTCSAGVRRGYSSTASSGQRSSLWNWAAGGVCVLLGAGGASLYHSKNTSNIPNAERILANVHNGKIAYAAKAQMLDVSQILLLAWVLRADWI